MSPLHLHKTYSEKCAKGLFSVTLSPKPKQIRMLESVKHWETLNHFYNNSEKLIRLFMQAGLQTRPKGLKEFFERTLQLRIALERGGKAGSNFTNPSNVVPTEEERTRLMEENHDEEVGHADVLFKISQTARFLCKLYAITNLDNKYDWHSQFLVELEEIRDDLKDARTTYPKIVTKNKDIDSQAKSKIARTIGVTSEDTMEDVRGTATTTGFTGEKCKRERDAACVGRSKKQLTGDEASIKTVNGSAENQ